MKIGKVKLIQSDLIQIDNRVIKLKAINGARYKYIGEDYVIKTHSTPEWAETEKFKKEQTLNEIKLLAKIHKSDRKYFPKVYKASKRHAYIIQERLRFQRGKMSDSNMQIIRNLAAKYHLNDVDADSRYGIYNCGVRLNGVPVIYDFGL